MESIVEDDVFASKCKSQKRLLFLRNDPNLTPMQHVHTDEISKKKRKLIQGPTEEFQAEKPRKRRRPLECTVLSPSHNTTQQTTLVNWPSPVHSGIINTTTTAFRPPPVEDSVQDDCSVSESESLELDCVMLTPSSSIESQDSPLSGNLTDKEDEVQDSDLDSYVPVPIFSHMIKASDDLLLSQTQCKAPVTRTLHDDHKSKINIGKCYQSELPKLITVRTESDMLHDIQKTGTRIWEPLRLSDQVVEEFEEYCKAVVRDSLPFCNDERHRNGRYMHDKALEILYDTNFDVERAKEIIVSNPELVTKKELCNERELAKIRLGFQTYGRNFGTIHRELLFDETVNIEDVVNLYYLFKKRGLLPKDDISRIPIIYEEDNDEGSDLDDSDDLSQNVQDTGDNVNDVFEGHEHSLDLITPPPSPLSIISSPHHMPMYHQIRTSTFESMDNTHGSDDASSLSCEDFLISIECSSGSDAKYDSDHSPVNFTTYDNNIKIDDLFSLSNSL
jgi:hypothetical protein